MAIPSVRIHTETPNTGREASHVAKGPTVRMDPGILAQGYGAIFDGWRQLGEGVREVGKTVRQFAAMKGQMDADNLSAATKTLTQNGKKISPNEKAASIMSRAKECGFRQTGFWGYYGY